MRKSFILIIIAIILAVIASMLPDKIEYKQITMEEAKSIIDSQVDYVLLDVRTQAEYDEGHIPGAVCIPNESITGKDIAELPDKNSLILVYCRSGNRSKQAAQKLADMGYKNVREFGGITDWTGETEKS
ncbi:MAG: rhodanese-like domain-containing protein [Bacillota bacterium]|nr:rhodanese-like domain-containing protein [Bacillota bacterium]